MKTTLELPESLLREVQAAAAACGQSPNDFTAEALRQKIAAAACAGAPAGAPWMQGFGKLRWLRSETERIRRALDEEIEPEDRS